MDHTSAARTKELVFASLNFCCCLSIIVKMTNQTYHTGFTYWQSAWSYFELTFSLSSFIVALMIILKIDDNQYLRWIEAVGALAIWFLSLYYLQLFDKIAPLIIIIFKIYSDITPFLKLLGLFTFAFTNAFYLLGRNQL